MSQHYKPYPKYKPSGVEWLGDVPAEWEVSRLSKHFSERREKVSDKEYPPLSVTMQGIVPRLETAAKTDAGDNRKKVCIGDFTINSRSDRKGSSGVSALEGSVSLISIVLAPRSIDGLFVHHLLRSRPFQEEFYRYGKGIVADLWSTNYTAMKNILLAIPPQPEQRAIAEFLDRETGKLDQLVDKQERMIKLLKEKRQAVISHAVTKGLNPNAPMKDSGIEWLGDVPQAWQIKSVKAVAKVGNGSTPKRENNLYWGKGTYPWLNSSVVNQKQVTKADQFITELALSECHLPKLKPPVILIGITGQGRTRGLATTLLCEATINQHIAYVKVWNKLVSTNYLRNTFDMAYPFLRYESEGGGSTKGAITCEQIKTLKIPIPPLAEQHAIVQHLETSTTKIDNLVAKSERAIEPMKERRVALISAAVTGKIDVRATA